MMNIIRLLSSHHRPRRFVNHQRRMSPQSAQSQQMQTSQRNKASLKRGSETESEDFPFDICRFPKIKVLKLDKPLHESENEVEFVKNASEPQYLRSGMVLLKNFICHTDQVKIVNICRDLGIGLGGFYRPRYESGAKLNLQMMCLGKDWDPQSRLYTDSRRFDGAVPPEIPEELRKQVDDALEAARKLCQIERMKEIPNMSPDICIVNFYSESGKLGLHQDKDESKESIEKGLPIVSFSIGDSAEFLYSKERNASKAEKITLESGDVLIFGGESRLIFHGVSFIEPNTAPKLLMDETNLCTGRLNLTFRQSCIHSCI